MFRRAVAYALSNALCIANSIWQHLKLWWLSGGWILSELFYIANVLPLQCNVSYASMCRMTSASQQQLCLQGCRRCRPRSSLVSGQESTMCDIVWMSPQTNISLSVRPHSFDMCRSDPVLSGNGSLMTTGVEGDGNWELGLWNHLPVRSWSPWPTAKLHATDLTLEQLCLHLDLSSKSL